MTAKKAEETMKALRQKIMDVASAIEPLAKLNDNTFGKYKFVSIDQYYDQVRAVALEKGLWWRIREINYQLNEKTVTYTFEVDVFTADDVWEGYDQLHQTLAYTNAQTLGIARSYADKAFMRTAFKMVTGEPDADFFDSGAKGETTGKKKPEPKQEAPQPAPETKPEPPKNDLDKPPESGVNLEELAGKIIERHDTENQPKLKTPTPEEAEEWPWTGVAETMIQFSELLGEKQQLVHFWQENAGVMDQLQTNAPKLYEKVKAHFTKRRQSLASKG